MPEEAKQEDTQTITQIALLNQAITQVLRGQDEIKQLFNERIEDHEERLRVLEKSTTELSARLTLWQIGQSVFTTFASVVAAVVGKMP